MVTISHSFKVLNAHRQIRFDHFKLETKASQNLSFFFYLHFEMNNDSYIRKDGSNNCSSVDEIPETIVIINCALNVPLIVICIIANPLVLAAILKNPSLHSPSTTFLCFLASSDLLVGAVAQPIYIIHELKVASKLNDAMHLLTMFISGVSICFMAAIGVDRFLALKYHLRYSGIMTTKRAIYTSLALCLTCSFLSCLPLWSKAAYHVATAAGITVCIVISIFSYIQIFRIVRRHRSQIHIQQQVMQDQVSEDHSIMRLKKSALNTFIYFSCMMLCYSPLLVSMLLLAIIDGEHSKAWRFADTLAFINSSINPFLYYWRVKNLRNPILNILRPVLCKQSE